MIVEILGRNTSGTCSLTGKTGVEVWSLRARGGQTQQVSTQRLSEVLRVLSSVGTDSRSDGSSSTDFTSGLSHSVSEGQTVTSSEGISKTDNIGRSSEPGTHQSGGSGAARRERS